MSAAIDSAVRLLHEGRYADAEAAFNLVLKGDANNEAALHGLSVVAFQSGDKARAEQMLRQLLALAPTRTSARYDLACMLIEQGRDLEALPLLETVVAERPEQASAWYQLGFARRAQGHDAEAEQALSRCLSLAPAHPEAAQELARVYRDRGDYPRAMAVFERAAEHPQASPRLYQFWARFASMSALPRQELAALQRGVQQFVADADLRIELGRALEGDGAREHAALQYQLALSFDAGRGFAIGGLLSLLGGDADQTLVAQGERILADPQARDGAKAVIGYGLGKAQQARQNYEAAFSAWQQANAARRREAGSFDRSVLVQQIEELRSVFAAEQLRALSAYGSDDDRPVFIVGMPRSGTTLVEQIIASHPEAEGLGELPDLPIVADAFCKRFGAKGHWPNLAAVQQAGPEVLRAAAEHYLRVVDYRLPHAARRIVDKAPLNFFNVGLISLLFPKARIIWCRRDPRDVCLSIYSEDFAPTQKYATDLSDLGFFYRQHEALMSFWRDVVVTPIHEVVYEDLIADQEAYSRLLIEFVGLDWDPACLQFHKTARAVQTPSRWQVRKPLYKTSVERWRRYEPWLGPLFEALKSDSA